MRTTLTTLLAIVALVSAHAHDGSHSHRARSLPSVAGRSAEKEAELHKMFKRQSGSYPPADTLGPAPLAAWTATYNKARQAGLIPTFANSVNRGGTPTYPAGVNGQDNRVVCSWTLTNCNATTDIVNAPDGMIGISFDDGPQPAATPLYKFLQSNNIPSTHFMIGSRILDNPAIFKSALAIGGHIAVHTWSHPLMTTMTDAQVLGELGWCLQIIYDNSGGLLPQFWRPPYGDVDNRVRAIAQQVFGLTTVIWNKDTDDWCLNDDGTNACRGNPSAPTTDAQLANELTTFLNGPKSPGLIILEHEHKVRAVNGFMNTAWPLIQSQNWKMNNIPSLFGLQYYQNAANDNSTVQSMAVAANPVTAAVPLAAGASVPAVSAVSRGASGSVGTGLRTLTVNTVVSAVVPSTQLASMSAAALAVEAAAQANLATPLSTGAKVGIAAGAAVGAVLLILLATCFFVRRRRGKQARGGSNVTTHPYNDMMDSKSTLALDEKDVSPAKVTPTLLYAHNGPTARKSALSLYSQHDPQEVALDSYFQTTDTAQAMGRSASRTTQRFHLPTSAVKTGAPYAEPQAAATDKAGWL